MSPARHHKARVLAALTAGGPLNAANDNVPPDPGGAAAHEYKLHLAQIFTDRAKLKQVQSLERKIELKRQLLPAYDAWIQGVLEGAATTGKGVNDQVLATIMVWRIDVGALDGALPLARYVLDYGVELPPQFQRKPATLIAEQFADTAIEQTRNGQAASLEALGEVMELLGGRDMPDEVWARLHKAAGLEIVRRVADPKADLSLFAAGPRGAQSAALQLFREADRISKGKAGVKAEITKLEKALAAPRES